MELARKIYRNLWVIPKIHRVYRKLSLTETFTRIYASGAWNDNSGEDFCSGTGSGGDAADQYCRNVAAFIRSRAVKSVVDLGCGDFRVGRTICSSVPVRYVGVDIVQALVDRNNAKFSDERISFQCANLLTGPLPEGQLCLIRQVLQHLSNAEIEAALQNVSRYPLALISEHVPKFPKSFNRDKPHGPDVRAYYGSGVYLEHPPFSRRISVLWEIELDNDSLLRTVLFSAETQF